MQFSTQMVRVQVTDVFIIGRQYLLCSVINYLYGPHCIVGIFFQTSNEFKIILPPAIPIPSTSSGISPYKLDTILLKIGSSKSTFCDFPSSLELGVADFSVLVILIFAPWTFPHSRFRGSPIV